jgi:aldehyde:ferredoxin oxidoreductase
MMRIDMGRTSATMEPLPVKKPQDRMVGGRAIIDWFMTERVSPRIHPLSAGSPFIAAPGILAGTGAPSAGRISIGGKSPLTGGIKEANAGGTAAYRLGRLGISAIVVEGKASEWTVLRIGSKGVAFEPASDVVGLDNYEACAKLRERYGEKVGIIITGPAGERLYANSTVAVTDLEGRPCRHAARGGVGAIMGAKRLKAIVIDDTDTSLRKASDQAAFLSAVKSAIETMKTEGPYCDIVHTKSTVWSLDIDNGQGALQTYNYHQGSFDKARNINADRFMELNRARVGSSGMGHSCSPGCVVQCSNLFYGPTGELVTAAFEYETLTFLGSNLGIDDIDAIARMDRKCDGLGIDTIETGSAIGILNDVGLFEFGDVARAEALIEEIAKGTLMGRVLGNGTQLTAKVFGIDRVPTVKGQAISAHSGRALKGWGVTFATSPQGADHTAGPVAWGDFLSPVGQVALSRDSQIINTAIDATGLCHFTFAFIYPQIIMPMINAFLGTDFTLGDFLDLGKEMLLRERSFNLKAGIGPGADALPEWMRFEPLPPKNSVFDVPQEEIDEFFNFELSTGGPDISKLDSPYSK